ncbi:MAG: sorbosone dehydrogenase family protein [Candidatus Nitrosocosmicus sp.]
MTDYYSKIQQKYHDQYNNNNNPTFFSSSQSADLKIGYSKTSLEDLERLPTSARPVVDANDVVVPEGYDIEPVIVGLSFPLAITFADDGTIFLAEGGSTWPPRPYMPSRLLKLDPLSGKLDVIAIENLAGLRGITWKDDAIYAAIKGGYFSRIVKYDLKTGERIVIVDKLPDGGWHSVNGPIFGQDGLLYFGQGSVSLNGIAGTGGFAVDLAKHPFAHDVPGQDVELTGKNCWNRYPTAPFPYLVETGAYKPFGTPSEKREIIKGQLFCTTGLMRCKPDGSEPELLAWGIRNGFGMAFDEEGDLFVADFCMEEKDPRPIGEDPGRIWKIQNAKSSLGSVDTPDWYGFPDYCGDGLPVTDKKHMPMRGSAPELLIANQSFPSPSPSSQPSPSSLPPLHLVADKAVFLNEPHTGMGKMDFCRSDEFGYRGQLFMCQFGTFYPLNSLRPRHENNGFNVVRIDVNTGTSTSFAHNKFPGPASSAPSSTHDGISSNSSGGDSDSGGIERPVDCKFSPDGKSLYVVDFGRMKITKTHMVAYAHTGVLWKITKQG